MKRLLFTLLGFLIVPSSVLAELVPFVESIRLGSLSQLPSSSALAAHAQRLISSCSVDASKIAGNPDSWDRIVQSDSFLLVKYKQEVTFTTANREHKVREILIPLPKGDWPAHVLTRASDNFFACSKYDPKELANIACSNEVGLKRSPPYAELCANLKSSDL